MSVCLSVCLPGVSVCHRTPSSKALDPRQKSAGKFLINN